MKGFLGNRCEYRHEGDRFKWSVSWSDGLPLLEERKKDGTVVSQSGLVKVLDDRI